MSCYEIIDNILSLLNIVAIVVLANFGYEAWKKQQLLIERHNIARELLKSVNLLRKKIDYVRSPFMFAGEVESGFKKLDRVPTDLDQRQKQELGKASAYFERWRSVAEIGSEFETLKVEAKIVLEIDLDKILKNYDKIINDVKLAMQMYAENSRALVYDQIKTIPDELLTKYMKDLMQGYSAIDDEDDPIDKRFDKEIKLIEKSLEVFLKLRK